MGPGLRTNLSAGRRRPARIAWLVAAIVAVAPAIARAQIHTGHDHIPNFAATPTIRSATSGAWSAVSTWYPARLPGPGDIVSIAHAVVFDTTAGDVEVVGVEAGGVLRFATGQSTRLEVATLIVLPGGRLEVGTPLDPVAPSVTAEIVIKDRALNLAADPDQFGTGLLVIDAAVVMHGAPRTPTFVRTAVEPRAGHTAVTLAEPAIGWAVGDRIFLPDTRQVPTDHWFNPNWPLQMEERTIAGISADRRTLTLTAPLTFDHKGARDAGGAPTVLPDGIRLLPHVANFTRNIVIRSANPSGTRGHTLFTSRADVRIHYVQFRDLGRTRAAALDSVTNRIGRYPVHIHHVRGPANPTNTGYQFVLLGNAITDSLKWPLAVHGSHFGLVRQNVIVGGPELTGAGIAVEDGSETENLFEENFVAHIRGDVNPRNSGPGTSNGETPGSAAECIWAAGFNNRFVNNVVTGCRNPFQQIVSGPGFKFIVPAAPYQTRNPRFRGADMVDPAQTIDVVPQRQPLLEFRGNEVYGLAADGLTVWQLGTDGYAIHPTMGETRIVDFRVWHTYEAAVWNYPINRMTIERLVYRIDSTAGVVYWPTAVSSGDYRDVDLTIRGGSIHAGSVFAGVTDPLGVIRLEGISAVTYDAAFSFDTPATPGTGAGRPASGVTVVLVGNTIQPWPGRPLRTIAMNHDLSRGNSQPGDPYNVFVFDYQGQAGHDFRAYFGVQATEPLYGGLAPCTDTTTRPEVQGITCPMTGTPPPPPTNTPPGNAIANGDFSYALTGWQVFSAPGPGDITVGVTGGVLQFYRAVPPPGAANQAVVFQSTTLALGFGEPMVAEFELGNSSSVRKRISIVIHNGDFSDLSLCTFWLPPGAPLRTYRMRAHTTQSWPGATIAFYAASTGSDGGFYLVDNVSLRAAPANARTRTDCVDPDAPAPPGGPAGPNLVANGAFTAATLGPWSVFGNLTWQLAPGAFAFHRPTAAPPAGVILQPTGQAIAAGDILTATFRLGNTSAVRKRVTAVLHDRDFGDLSACTFWLAPGQAPSPYSIQSFATKPWANTTLSFYSATVGAEAWMLLTDVTLQRTPGLATVGTECVEPERPVVMLLEPAGGVRAPSRSTAPAGRAKDSEPQTIIMTAGATDVATIALDDPIDLTKAAGATVTFLSRLRSRRSGEVQASTDGVTWVTLAPVATSDDWTPVRIALDELAGRIVYLRFVLTGGDAETAARWWLINVLVRRYGS